MPQPNVTSNHIRTGLSKAVIIHRVNHRRNRSPSGSSGRSSKVRVLNTKAEMQRAEDKEIRQQELLCE